MKKSRFSESQIKDALKRVEAGLSVTDVWPWAVSLPNGGWAWPIESTSQSGALRGNYQATQATDAGQTRAIGRAAAKQPGLVYGLHVVSD
jgi:hypothetical protein